MNATPVPSIRQSGAALIVTLMFLVVMTLIGVGAMHSTILEEKMAGAYLQRQKAFQLTERALRYGEKQASNMDVVLTVPASGCSNGICAEPPDRNDRWKNIVQNGTMLQNNGDNNFQTYYMIEYQGRHSAQHRFQITAYSQGDGTSIWLQTQFQRP